jgi:hypothetical protein
MRDSLHDRGAATIVSHLICEQLHQHRVLAAAAAADVDDDDNADAEASRY